MKVAFVNTNLITCGGILTNYEYVTRLRKLGYEANLYAQEGNPELENTYNLPHHPLSALVDFTDDDVIIANRWEQVDYLTPFSGKKFQFVQGDDLALLGEDQRKECARARNNGAWGLIGVSTFVLMRWMRGEVIPNGVNERFYEPLGLARDIDILIEGNNEPNKNIPAAIQVAKSAQALAMKPLKIVWLGRETYKVDGVETITNPPQEEIPSIYQRSKVMVKLSNSEGFCLPILEAMASGCLVATRNMGGNDDWCVENVNCIMDNLPREIADHLLEDKHRWIAEKGKETAKEFTWNKSVAKLTQLL